MIRRLYVHNFRCLENFELSLAGLSSVLLIGKNGSGKTAVGRALEVLQKIGSGTNRVSDLVKPADFASGHTDVPMRFELEVELDARTHTYGVAFELPRGFKELSVLDEKLVIDGTPVYTRDGATMRFSGTSFQMSWNRVALPIFQQPSGEDSAFRLWLASMLILRPIPGLIRGDSTESTLVPTPSVMDFGAWFSGLLAHDPSAYTRINNYLKQIMPDLLDIKNPLIGADARSLLVQFANGNGSMRLAFEDLSDGEKCFMICALVLAANEAYGPLVCFWDEPDNYLAPSEVQHFILDLRNGFQSKGQFIATSHNPEAIRSFSDENTLLLYRNSHLEPTIVRPIKDLQFGGDLVDALVLGDLEP